MRGLPVNTTINPTMPVHARGADITADAPAFSSTQYNDRSSWPLLSVMLRYQRHRWLGPLLLIVASMVGLATRPVYASDPSFAQAMPLGANDPTLSVAVGDLNGDGWLDIVQGNQGQSYLYLNDGQGSFFQRTPLGSGELTMSVAVGDFNGDGWLDILQGNLGQSYLYPNDRQGHFTQRVPVGKSELGMHVVMEFGDFDGNGWLDIIQGGSSGQGYLYLNDGQGHFATTGRPVGNREEVIAIAVGDMTGDDRLDIVLSYFDQTYVYLNDGQGGFTQRIAVGNGGKIAVGDINGDGRLDIVQGSSGQSYVYLNDQQASFTQRIPLGNGEPTTSIRVGDFNGDGRLDIVQGTSVPIDSTGQDYVYLNDGNGGFTQRIGFGSNRSLKSIAVGDLNSDGWLDIVQGNFFGQSYLYFNDGQSGFTQRNPVGNSALPTPVVGVGDFNHDGRLDVVVQGTGIGGQGYVYLNNGNGGFIQHAALDNQWPTESIAVGDLNNDGRLDIVQGNRGQSYLFLNDEQASFTQRIPFGFGESTTSVGVGDFNNDGWLDIIQGNESVSSSGHSYLYLNDGHGGFPQHPIPVGASELTSSIGVGDFNGDGWLDIIQGNTRMANMYIGQSYVYLNDGNSGFTQRIPVGNDASTQSVAVGDLNGDGWLDIIQGNRGQSYLYLNNGQGGFIQRILPSGSMETNSVAVGDLNGDGWLDIILGNLGQSYAYLNDRQGNFTQHILLNADANTSGVAVGDFNGDGWLDILQGNTNQQSYVYWNGLRQATGLVNHSPLLAVRRPGPTGNADFFSTPIVLSNPTIPITYTLFDPEGDRVGRIEAFYSPDGGGQWLPAVAARGAITQHLPTAPAGITYTFPWDTFASGFFGQSDNVVIRLVAYSQPSPAAIPLTGGYRYTNTVPGPYLWPYASATTFPFRVRGTQVRVVDNNNSPVANAQVYRLPRGTVSGAELLPNASQPLTTSVDGYLGGRGAMAVGDQLMALAPLSRGPNYTLYATSGIPNEKGLTMTLVAQAGVQTLQVSNEHPLLLFNLNVSVEWDASNDGLFYDQLKTAFARASAILYDASDGQIALGEVRLHPNRAEWQSADIVIYANNNLRPRATMGGVVERARDEAQGLRGDLPNAYVPGQVRLGPIWDPFGQNAAELTQDWQRALAHELGHYLLFLPDNYMGVDNGLLRITDCHGSIMTDAYNPDYSEFLTPLQWHTPNDPALNPCLRTVAAKLLTGRSDWETVTHFYPGLHIPVHPLVGPALLPLNVTHVQVIAPPTVAQPVTARNYDLRDETGEVTILRQAQAYVLQSQGTETTTDDSLLYLGSTGVGSDHIMVRGARAGDKVCVIDSTPNPIRIGCTTVTPQSTSIQVQAVPGWRPDVQVTPLTSTTFQITVTQAVNVGPLSAQLLPAYGPIADAASIQSVTEPLTPLDATHYTARITTGEPVFEGFIRIYSQQNPDQQQAITQFFVSGDWGPPHAWGGANRAWGANVRSLEAPAASSDGKVSILNLNDLLADTGSTVLQAVTDLPNRPIWLTPVGAGYRFMASNDLPRTLMFEYNQRDVPPGYEQTLALYYLPQGSTSWQRLITGPLATGVDANENLATATMPAAGRGEGIYALMATVQLPALVPGWNPFNYPIGAAQTVTSALASLDGAFTTLYEYQLGAPLPWPVYDRTVDPAFAPLVNTLSTMAFGHNYLIYTTQSVTPYIPVGGDGKVTAAVRDEQRVGLVEPPALFYGSVPTQQGASISAGMTIQAKIGDVVCGESQLQAWHDQLVYVIQVKADTGEGCGRLGQPVAFVVNGRPLPDIGFWDNHQANAIPSGTKLYLPFVAR